MGVEMRGGVPKGGNKVRSLTKSMIGSNQKLIFEL